MRHSYGSSDMAARGLRDRRVLPVHRGLGQATIGQEQPAKNFPFSSQPPPWGIHAQISRVLLDHL